MGQKHSKKNLKTQPVSTHYRPSSPASSTVTTRSDLIAMLEEIEELGLEAKSRDPEPGPESGDREAATPPPVTIRTHGKRFLSGSKPTSSHFLFELTTDKLPGETKRHPFDLCVVLDRSGSMSGSKLNQAKEAISLLMSKMDEDDRLHLVVYDDRADVVFSHGKKSQERELQKKLNNVNCGGCTNISDGLMAGFRLLTQERSDGVQAGKRIFLFSDGMVNRGINTHDAMFELVSAMQKKNISITTVGIGAGFDEVVMRGIAEHGRGQYIYIKDAQDIPDKVGMALKALAGMVAKDCTLQITCEDNVILQKGYAYSGMEEGVVLGDMSEDDRRQVVMQLKVTPPKQKKQKDDQPVPPGGPSGDSSNVRLLKWTISYYDCSAKRQVTQNGTLVIDAFDDHDADTEKLTDMVRAYVAVAESSEKDKEILALLANPSNEAREAAVRVKEEIIAELEAVNGVDPTGNIAWLLNRAKTSLEALQRSKNFEMMAKEVAYDQYQASYGLCEAGLI